MADDKKAWLLGQLESYKSRFPQEIGVAEGVISFMKENEDCYVRENLSGHLTASAFITNSEQSHLLLLHHYKLDKWLQPGGHADGETDLKAVAKKEVEEETGLCGLSQVSSDIYDIDIHTIPERKEVGEHLHFDIRFHFEADSDRALVRNSESNEVAWVPLASLGEYSQEESILRMVRKFSS